MISARSGSRCRHGCNEPRRSVRPAADGLGRDRARLGEGITQAPGTGGPNRHTCWLATINADGTPHVTGIGALWDDGAFWFETGEHDAQGTQPRPRPALHAERGHRRVRPRRGGRGRSGHRPADRGDAWRRRGPPRAGRPRSTSPGTALTARVQRAVGRPAAVVRLPAHAARGRRLS